MDRTLPIEVTECFFFRCLPYIIYPSVKITYPGLASFLLKDFGMIFFEVTPEI